MIFMWKDLNTGMLCAILDGNAKLQGKIDYLIELHEKMLTAVLDISHKNVVANDIAPDTIQPNIVAELNLIDTLEDIKEFEKKLCGKEFYQAVLFKFQSVCGPTSRLSGDTISYKLVDSIFTRQFFTHMSWTGLSRTDQPKGKFSAFTKTIAFFFQLVLRCDSNYTEMQLQFFFRKIMDNSARRYIDSMKQSTGKRLSSARNTTERKKRKEDSQSNVSACETDDIDPLSSEAAV